LKKEEKALNMKKIFCVFGTRPEAIKMVPVVKALQLSDKFKTKVLLTAQHREMLDQVMDFFQVKGDFDLNLMKSNQTLYDVTGNVLHGVGEILEKEKPDLILVHGDTTTTMASSLAAFYQKIPVGHVEAGLRTGNIYSPFPEEMNRKITGSITKYHFSPTESSKQNLLQENVSEKDIIVTGNTVIDALHDGLSIIKSSNKTYPVDELLEKIEKKKIILVTGHRRENFGEGFLNICKGLKEIAENNSDVEIIYPVHLNPNVRKPVFELLEEVKNIHLIEPLQYEEFIYLMDKSYFILTDSGGIQEEAPSLGKPVLVMRDTTERPEAVDAGTVKLVGTDLEKIVFESQKLIENKEYYETMSKAHNPYGDGRASIRIKEFLESEIGN
jgi:UDP-N-acetylglucosamine 2-epimerase (non-hydrolysing)